MEQVKCAKGSFGNYREECPGACEWRESCKLCSSTNPDQDRKTSRSVDICKNEFRINHAEAADDCNHESLISVLSYILSLDDNTFDFICEVIANPSVQQAELARRRGVSRQRINTAVLHSCLAHPELTSLLQLCVSRKTILRNRYARKTVAIREATPNLPGME